MKFTYFILGAILFSLLTILYDFFDRGSVSLNSNYMAEIGIRSMIAILAFLASEMIIKNSKK